MNPAATPSPASGGKRNRDSILEEFPGAGGAGQEPPAKRRGLGRADEAAELGQPGPPTPSRTGRAPAARRSRGGGATSPAPRRTGAGATNDETMMGQILDTEKLCRDFNKATDDSELPELPKLVPFLRSMTSTSAKHNSQKATQQQQTLFDKHEQCMLYLGDIRNVCKGWKDFGNMRVDRQKASDVFAEAVMKVQDCVVPCWCLGMCMMPHLAKLLCQPCCLLASPCCLPHAALHATLFASTVLAPLGCLGALASPLH